MGETRQKIELADLVERAKVEGPAAIAELVHRYRPTAFSTAYSILGDYHLAEDAVQESFLAAYFSLSALRENDSFAAWLQGIVKNKCRRILRRRDLAMTAIDESQHATLGGGPIGELERKELHRLIRAAIETLSVDQRDCASLFYLGEKSQRQVAEALGLPITTVNYRLHAARKNLKERISIMSPGKAEKRLPKSVKGAVGTIVEADDPLYRVKFDQDEYPDVHDALVISDEQGRPMEVLKIIQRTNDGQALAIRTHEKSALDLGEKIVNTGLAGLGMTLNIGPRGPSDEDVAAAIEKLTTAAKDQGELLETGIKPIDLLCPFAKGGSVAIPGIQGIGRIVLVEELFHRLRDDPDGLTLIFLVSRAETDSVRGMMTADRGYEGDVSGKVNVAWMLTDRAPDPDWIAGNTAVAATAYFSPILAFQGLYPSIDPVRSTSSLLDPSVVGEDHFAVAAEVVELMRRSRELMADAVFLDHVACRLFVQARERARTRPQARLAELSPGDRVVADRGRKIERFLTTPFHVAEEFTGIAPKHVPLKATIDGCRRILAGEFDELPEEALLYIGEIDEAYDKAPA